MSTRATSARSSQEQPAPVSSDAFVPPPAFATMEEVRFAHSLRLQLRARLVHDVASPSVVWPLGVD